MGQAPYVLAGICIALVAAVPAFADPSVAAKRAEAQQVMGQLRGLPTRSSGRVAVRRLDGAAAADPARPAGEQARAPGRSAQPGASQHAIAPRLVSLLHAEQTSTLEVILGARSLDDMINRLDNAKSVTNLDATCSAR